jgi:hypothetical protein
LAKQLVAVYAFSQAIKVCILDATLRKVLAPPIDHLNDAHHFSCSLRRGVAEKFALRNGIGER